MPVFTYNFRLTNILTFFIRVNLYVNTGAISGRLETLHVAVKINEDVSCFGVRYELNIRCVNFYVCKKNIIKATQILLNILAYRCFYERGKISFKNIMHEAISQPLCDFYLDLTM